MWDRDDVAEVSLESKEMNPQPTTRGALGRHCPFPFDSLWGWQATSFQEGNSLGVGWEKKFKSSTHVLRENKNLSVWVYENISYFIPAGGKIERKNTPFSYPGWRLSVDTDCRFFHNSLSVPHFSPVLRKPQSQGIAAHPMVYRPRG